MTFGKEIEHGGYPTSETRTISQMRRDADAYAGIGRRGRWQGVKEPFTGAKAEAGKEPIAGKEPDAGKEPTAGKEPEAQKLVDTTRSPEVSCSHAELIPPTSTKDPEHTMTLTLKGLSKNGKNAFYSGAATVLRLSLSAFVGKTAPQSIEVADGIFAPAAAPKVKMTKEERKAAQAAKPKPTEAEKIAQAEAKLAARKAKLAQAEQPSL